MSAENHPAAGLDGPSKTIIVEPLRSTPPPPPPREAPAPKPEKTPA